MNIDLTDNAVWQKFIRYAFEASDMFSLTNYSWSTDNNLNYTYYRLTEQLKEYEETVFSESLSHGIWGEYSISYFKCNFFTMDLISEIPDIREMVFPKYPEDICFYLGNEAWFKSTTHDEIWTFINILDDKQNFLSNK